MDMLPESLVERFRAAQRCQSDIRQIAQDMSGLAPDQYNALAIRLIEGGEDHALGILLNAAAVNKICFDPAVLASSLKVVNIIIDIKYPYNYQDESAIAPLLTVALSEDLSFERQILAARLSVELALKFNYPRQPVKKVLWKLMEDIRSGEARFLLQASLDLLENADESKNSPLRLHRGDVLSELPAERPPVVIGDGGTVRRPVARLGRNEPCRCGSGKKYKKCCYDEDQTKIRDASSYGGVTKSQLRENPSLVEDASYIEELRPYELRKLVPSRMNDDQLLTAYRRADIFGLRELAFAMLLELKGRPGKEELAVEHMSDLFDSALTARDTELIRKLSSQLPEEQRYFSEADRLKHELLENTEKYRDLEAMCKKAFVKSEKHWLLELSYAFEDILPALSIVFGRAAILSEPERWMDNETLIDAIHKRRIELDLEPWGDPIEDYWDWIAGKDSEGAADEDKNEKIRELQELLSEAREKSSLALKDLREKERELEGFEKKFQQTMPTKVATANGPTTDKKEEGKKQDIDTLRRKIDTLKDEIRSQQESKRLLRKELQDVNERIARQNKDKAPTSESHDEEPVDPTNIPEKINVPEFSDAFRRSCENLPSTLVARAIQAAVGFAVRDVAVLRQTVGIERMPGHYRIRIGIHHRLIVRQSAKNELQIVDVIPRKQFDTWIRQHSP